MATLTVKTRLPTRDVQARFVSLPKILAGSAPDPLGLRRMFFAIFARKLYSLIYEAYKIKSLGGTDSLGHSWRGLKKRTVKRRLSSSFLSRYPLSAQLLVNRVNDRLLESFRPGQVSGANYIPSREQRYLLESFRLLLGSEVPYAAKVHAKRRLWPARMRPWIEQATNLAFDHVLIRLTRSLES